MIEIGICKNSYNEDDEDYLRYDIPSHVVEYLRKNSMKPWFEAQKATWNSKFATKFAEIFTRRGMAFSFNLPDADKLFNMKE